jgi:hypothetical protein
MELKRGQALFARPAARVHPPPAAAPDGRHCGSATRNGRLQRLSTIPEPEVMVALVIIGNGMQSIAA